MYLTSEEFMDAMNGTTRNAYIWGLTEAARTICHMCREPESWHPKQLLPHHKAGLPPEATTYGHVPVSIVHEIGASWPRVEQCRSWYIWNMIDEAKKP